MMIKAALAAPLLASLLAAACAPPHRDLPVADIQNLGKLSDVMDVQATVADPQMAKRDQTSFTDADWPAFDDVSKRITATSQKIKSFSKGPEFDKFADELGAAAGALGTAAAAKDAAGAAKALTTMKSVCKGCHSKFK